MKTGGAQGGKSRVKWDHLPLSCANAHLSHPQLQLGELGGLALSAYATLTHHLHLTSDTTEKTLPLNVPNATEGGRTMHALSEGIEATG